MQNEKEKFKKNLNLKRNNMLLSSLHFELHFDFCILNFEFIKSMIDKIDKKEVQHLAKLSRLELSDKEIEKFTKDISSILDYVSELQKVDTQNVEPISQITGLSDVKRKDEPKEFKNKKGIFDNAPEKEGDFFKVKTVLGRKR